MHHNQQVNSAHEHTTTSIPGQAKLLQTRPILKNTSKNRTRKTCDGYLEKTRAAELYDQILERQETNKLHVPIETVEIKAELKPRPPHGI